MFSPENCNRKLIGARAFWKGYEAAGGKVNGTTEFQSARDSQGHGTHTASTAGGNLVPGASLFGNAVGSAVGMRPTARIAVYKAWWPSGCVSSDILAAVDRAVADGVDVLSLSLGGGSRPYYMDGIAIATFGAVQKGVFVSCSAGNSGPSESRVSNTAPWITTVAASYMDRGFPTVIKLGDGQTFKGASLYSGKPTGLLPLVYADNAVDIPSARYCAIGSLSRKLVKGKIVLCDRGFNGRTKKGEVVKLAGGAGMILASTEEQGEELLPDPHVLPASAIGASATTAIKAYIASANNPTAMITFLGTVYGTNPAPMITAFSSRGPSSVGPEIIKPDVAAPGMSILAAWPPSTSPSLLDSDRRRTHFNIISGTSMSCPHVRGLAALLKSAHQNWSPAAIKSALMTSARSIDNRNGSILDARAALPATPFALGSGQVDPEKAANPGLVYDIAPKDYLNYLCGLNYTPQQLTTVARVNYSCPKKLVDQAGDLNYPSFSVLFDGRSRNSKVTQARTVTNVGPASCKYEASVREPKGVSVSVDPKALAFSEIGQRLSYRVSFVGGGGGTGYSFGELVWACGEYRVRSPIAVTWQKSRRHA